MKSKLDNYLDVERERIAILGNLRELIFNFKVDGNFSFVNAVWLKKLHYEKWEALHLGFHDILQSDQIIKWRKVQQKLAHGTAYASLDFVFKTKKK